MQTKGEFSKEKHYSRSHPEGWLQDFVPNKKYVMCKVNFCKNYWISYKTNYTSIILELLTRNILTSTPSLKNSYRIKFRSTCFKVLLCYQVWSEKLKQMFMFLCMLLNFSVFILVSKLSCGITFLRHYFIHSTQYLHNHE